MYIPFVSRTYKWKWFDCVAVAVILSLSIFSYHQLFDELAGWEENVVQGLFIWAPMITYLHERANWSLYKKLKSR